MAAPAPSPARLSPGASVAPRRARAAAAAGAPARARAAAPRRRRPPPAAAQRPGPPTTAAPPPTTATRLPAAYFPDRALAGGGAAPPPLPPLRAFRHFANLTNGLEALPGLAAAGLPAGFVRLQSTRCEQGLLADLLADLDAGLLFALAAGIPCLVHDYGSRNKKRGAPRAVWMVRRGVFGGGCWGGLVVGGRAGRGAAGAAPPGRASSAAGLGYES
jgi:hypothetical protein